MPSSPAAENPSQVVARPTSSQGGLTLKWKVIYSLFALTICLVGLGFLAPFFVDEPDLERKRVYGSVAVFWVMLLFSGTKTLVWTVDWSKPAPSAVTDAKDAADTQGSKGAARRTRRA